MLSEARRSRRGEWNLAGVFVLMGTCSLPGGQREGLPLHGGSPASDRRAEQHGGRAEGARWLRPGSRAVQVSSLPPRAGGWQPREMGSVLLFISLDLFLIAGAESFSLLATHQFGFSPA